MRERGKLKKTVGSAVFTNSKNTKNFTREQSGKMTPLCPHSLPLVEFFIQILETLGLCEMTDRLTTVPSGRVSSSSLTDTTVPELSLFCSESRVPQ